MEKLCYLCNSTSKDWTQNLTEIKSKHSGTRIIEFIIQFLGDFASVRNIYDESHCICSACLSRIYAFDWMCMKVKEQEKVLKQMLIATETKFNEQYERETKFLEQYSRKNGRQPETIFVDANNGMENIIETKIEIKVEEEIIPVPDSPPPPPTPPLIPPEPDVKSAAPVKRSKPIIVRVVKRVPFLKYNSNALLKSSKPLTKVVKKGTSGEGSSQINLSSDTKAKTQKPQKTTKTGPVVCDLCDWQYESSKSLEVSQMDFY